MPDDTPPAAETEQQELKAAEEAAAADAVDLLLRGRIEEVLPPEELGEFHDFIREEALMRRRFAVSFPLECRCLAWISYQLANIVTHEDGIEFSARPIQTYVPDHEPDVEHPEGATEDPPEAVLDWPIWPFEIYQDELDELDEINEFEAADGA